MAAKKKAKKKTAKKKLATEGVTPKTKSANKEAAHKKSIAKAVSKKTIGGKTVSALKKQIRNKDQSMDAAPFSLERSRARSGRQSGDLQGLSGAEGADSESVNELLEEGNAFEADVVKGVEEAENSPEREVRTHEVPEDDIPDEYLDKE
jgi:hypothetical protein